MSGPSINRPWLECGCAAPDHGRESHARASLIGHLLVYFTFSEEHLALAVFNKVLVAGG